MSTLQIAIENLKCGGCANTITKGLQAMPGVSDVSIDMASSTVSLQADEGLRADVVSKLTQMGYPEVGSLSGLASGVATAKSFVSCAIGRIG